MCPKNIYNGIIAGQARGLMMETWKANIVNSIAKATPDPAACYLFDVYCFFYLFVAFCASNVSWVKDHCCESWCLAKMEENNTFNSFCKEYMDCINFHMARTCRLPLALGQFCQQSKVISNRQFADWPIVSNAIGLLVWPGMLPYHYVVANRLPL